MSDTCNFSLNYVFFWVTESWQTFECKRPRYLQQGIFKWCLAVFLDTSIGWYQLPKSTDNSKPLPSIWTSTSCPFDKHHGDYTSTACPIGGYCKNCKVFISEWSPEFCKWWFQFLITPLIHRLKDRECMAKSTCLIV